MSKRTWIKVKRGLLEPAHRDRMGVRVWLYLHILDIADWDTGKVEGWKDKEQADELDMPWRTLQSQRQQLERDGYIACAPAFQSQTITITNWTNPRSYSGDVLNEGTQEGTQNHVPTEQGTHNHVPIPPENHVPLHTVTLNHTTPNGVTEKPARQPSPSQLMFSALAEVCGYTDLSKLTGSARGMLNRNAKQLREAGYSPEFISREFIGWWKRNDWRGKKGQRPTPAQVVAEIGKVPQPQSSEDYESDLERKRAKARAIMEAHAS